MARYLCNQHNHDRTPTKGEAEITCEACRAEGFFSQSDLQGYYARFDTFGVWTRPLGYPETIKIKVPQAGVYDLARWAEDVGPKGSFKLQRFTVGDIRVEYSGNERIVILRKGEKADDKRKEWDSAPKNCY